jgi:serine/threonine-protein kinase HipA
MMSRRFDRDGTERLHMHSLGGMQHVDFNVPRLYSYEGLFRTILELQARLSRARGSLPPRLFNIWSA